MKNKRKRAKEAIEKYYFQLTEGCGRLNCSNINCASNESFTKLSANQAASKAVQLAREKSELCEFSPKSAKQFKPCTLSQPQTSASTSTEIISNSNHQDQEMNEELSDDEDIVFKSSRPSNSASSVRSSADLKSLDDALKFVTSINKNSDKINKDLVSLNETIILKLIKKCKDNYSETRTDDMETDIKKPNDYSELINLVQKVFQSYLSLSQSFMYDQSVKKIEISQTMPSIPPFNIDFNSVRRSYSLLFGEYFFNSLNVS